LTQPTESLTAEVALPDGISVGRWFLAYAALLVAAAVPLWLLAMRQDWATESWLGGGLAWRERLGAFADVFCTVSPALKLLAFAVYLSLCCTFLPLPTGWIVAAVATREAAVAASLSDNPAVVAAVTTVVVAAAGAAGSTIANLNDYHLFTWILRHRGVAKVRNTRTYHTAARWFARAPGLILVIFNVVPIPVDVVRMLAATSRYPRLPFAVANFVGRFLRYGVIAFVTFWWDLGWVAVVALLGLAVVLAAGKGLRPLTRKLFARAETPGSQESTS
jgi:membrane protein YqaA with SNARE-associated domain